MRIRRVIDGKVYDTVSAEQVAILVSCNRGWHDFHTEETRLFRSAKGQWFIAGSGGACTRWAKRSRDNDGNVAGTGLNLISSSEARRFLESCNGPVESYFEVEVG